MPKPQKSVQIDVPDNLFRELLTAAELRMVKHRYLIVQLIKRGLSIRAVAARAKVGTDTVVRILRKVESSKVLKKESQKQEEENKLSSSKWVFGRSDDKE